VPACKSLAATISGTSNLTIVYPLNDYSMEVSEYNSDNSFHDYKKFIFFHPLSGYTTSHRDGRKEGGRPANISWVLY
jgi:hypothetical protein